MKTKIRKERRVLYVYIVIFLILEVGIVMAGYLYYKNFEKNFKTNIENQLKIIADLKVVELELWIGERRADAQTVFGNEVFANYIKRYFKNPGDSVAKREIKVWMKEFKTGFDYDAVFLTDTLLNRRINIADENELSSSNILPQNFDSLKAGKLVFADFYLGKFKQKIFLKILIPILDEHKLVAVIELRIDPNTHLYPIFSNLSVPGETSETFILRQQDNEAVYLNELKFQKNTALILRIPLENKNILAVQAVTGNDGITKGIGYLGNEVIAYVEKVPNSPWYLVNQIDDREAYAPLREKLRDMVLFFLSIFLLAGMGSMVVWRNQRTLFYKERIKSAEALRESEERFRMMFDKAPLSYQSLDADGIFMDVNQTWLETFGYDREEVIGKWFGDFLAPKEVDAFKERFLVFIATGKSQSEFEIIHKNGTNRYISFEGRIAKDTVGNFIQTHGILQDITLQKKSELEQQVFYDIAQCAVTTSNLTESLKLIRQSIGKVLYADNLFVALYDQNTELFSFPYWIDEFDPTPEPVAMEKSLSAYVFRTGKPLLFSPELFQQLKDKDEVELVGSPSPSWIGVPLKTPDRTIGVLVLQHYEKENVYSEHDIKFLATIGNQIALIIERKQAEEDLRNERLLLRTVIDNIPDSIYCKDTATRKTLANLTNLRHCGVKSEAEILGKTDFDLFPKELAEGFYDDDQLVLQSGQPLLNREEYVLDEDGQKQWLLTSKLPLRDKNGKVIGLVGIGRDITISKLAEEALRESEIKLNVILESTADGILAIDGKGKIIKTNKRFAELWRIPQTLIDLGDNKALLDFVLSQLSNPEEFISKVQKLYNSVEEDLDLLYFKDERIFERFSSPLIMHDLSIGRVWSFRDITERKKAEAMIINERLLLRTLIDNIPDSIYSKDLDCRKTLVNLAELRHLKAKSDIEILGTDDFDLYPRELAEKFFADDQMVLQTGNPVLNREEYIFDENGDKLWLLTSKLPLRDINDQIIGLVGIGHDITNRKKWEAEIKLKNEELLKTNSEKDKFFSIIAHDLRSPFNGFLGLTQIMAEELSDMTMDDIRKIAVSMRNSATNLFRLLENLLEWSKMQQGLIPFEPKFVQLHPIVKECLEMMLEHAQNKGIEIEYIIPSDLAIFADINILQTVIRNLVSNAVKFTPKDGKIKVSAISTDNKYVEISIEDTGIGMSSKMIGNLFRLDLQTNRKGTEGEPSSGLGLLLCKEFIEKHGEKLWVESEEGKGSTFYFTIPYTVKSEEKLT